MTRQVVTRLGAEIGEQTTALWDDRPRRRRRARVPAGMTLALWRGARMWRLMLIVELGMVAAVLLVCAVPLFSQVALTAGLEQKLANTPAALTLDGVVQTGAPSPALYYQVEQRLAAVMRRDLRTIPVGSPIFQMTSQPLAFAHANGGPYDALSLEGYLDSYLGTRVTLLQGRLPHASQGELEIAMTSRTANALDLTLGSSVMLTSGPSNAVLLRLVGIVKSNAGLLGDPFEPHPQSGPNDPSGAGSTGYTAVVSADALLNAPYDWSTVSLAQMPPNGGYGPNFWNLDWSYTLDLTHLGPSDLNRLLDDPAGTQQRLFSALNGIPNTQNGFVESYFFQVLIEYKSRVVAGAILVSILMLDVLGLVLLFLGVMTNVLVDRQAATIAALRSRGASRRQIFGAFAAQGFGLGIVAAVTGPLLAILLVRLVASALLPAADQTALGVVSGTPLAVAASVWPYAAIMALVAALAMIWSLRKAAGLNVLAFRQEQTRERRTPLWQRLYLDVLAAILALAGYGSFALVNMLATSAPVSSPVAANANVSQTLSPLALVAPIFLMVATALLFLRGFPLLLRLGERLAARGRGATAMLALTQVARASRQASRTTLLLALTTCFALFTLTANATLAQHIRDAAAFQAGADISGGITTQSDGDAAGLSQLTAAYDAIPGMVSATLGYRAYAPIVSGNGAQAGINPSAYGPAGPNSGTFQIEAVDADTFASTGSWDAQDSPQSLASLMAMLRAHRAVAVGQDRVYAVVDADVWSRLQLHQGAAFSLPVPGYRQGGMHIVAAVEVAHIPTLFADQGGGILVDYQSYAAVYAADTGDTTGQAVAPNFVWLRTRDDAASLASVRAAIASGPLQVGDWASVDGPFVQMADRRAILAQLQTDPLTMDLTGILGIGGATALLLALFGTLIAAWLRVRNQLSTYALLRALGTAPRRLAALLVWEQGIIYVVALALGAILGAALALVALPALPDLAYSAGFGGPIDASGPPVHVVWPWPALALALAGLIVICGGALLLSARVASQPSLSQTLRLNEE